MIKLVLADVDETLLPAGQLHVSEKCVQAIHDLVKNDVLFGPSSGRDYTSVIDSFEGDAACLQTALLSSGKKVYVRGRLVDVTYVDSDAVARLIEIIRPLPGVYVAGRSDDERGFVCGITDQQLIHCTWGARRLSELTEELPEWPLVTVGLYFEEGSEDVDCDAVVAQIAEACPELDLIAPRPRLYDIVPKGWSKANGLKVLEAKLGLEPDEVLVFGDSDNDLELMREAGVSVAVSNANEAVSSLADYHIGRCEDDAVADAIEDIAKTAPWGEKPEFMRHEDHERLTGFGEDRVGSGLEKSQTGTGYILLGLAIIVIAAMGLLSGMIESIRNVITLTLTIVVGVVFMYVGVGRHRDWRRQKKEDAGAPRAGRGAADAEP